MQGHSERLQRRHMRERLYNNSTQFKTRTEEQKQHDNITDPIIDKIRIMKTFRVREDMKDMVETINTIQGFEVKDSRPLSFYRTCKTLHLPSNDPSDRFETVWVGINPFKKQIALDFCPSKLSDKAYDLLDKELFGLTRYGSFLNCYQDAKVLRLDTCRNVFDMRMEDFLFRGSRTQKHGFYIGGDACIETLYFGDENGSRFRIYDKKKQDPENYENHEFVVRVERMDKSPNLSLRDLLNYPNPLRGLEIYEFDVSRLPCVPKNYRRLFKYACWSVGIRSALEAIDVIGSERDKIVNQLKNNQWEPWTVAQEAWQSDWLRSLADYRLLVKAAQEDDE